MSDNAGWLGLSVGLLGVVITLLVYLWQRRPKRLDYRVVNNLAVLTEHATPMRRKLKMDYEGVQMSDPHIVTIRIQNTGKVAVVADDYVQPIRMRYENVRASPLDGSIAAESTPGICESLFDTDGEEESFEPVMVPELMNPGDWFEAQFVSDGDPGEIHVSCRFKDQSRPMKDMRITDEMRRQMLVELAPLGTLFLALLVSYAAFAISDSMYSLLPILATVVVLAGVTRAIGPSK